jgi:hypothetical protein
MDGREKNNTVALAMWHDAERTSPGEYPGLSKATRLADAARKVPDCEPLERLQVWPEDQRG